MDALPWVLLALAATTAVMLGVRLAATARRARALSSQLERDTTAERALAAGAERTRIAREMHDVVAHTLSVVVAQADGGQFAAPKDPDAATQALATIAEVARSALTEMRALLGILRDSEDGASLAPQPSLGDIPTLVASVRERGVDVSYVTTGTPHPLPIGAGLAAFRIVQEALTNVLKHAGPQAHAFVQLTWGGDALQVTIADDGRGAAARPTEGGLGVAGMAERASLFGGTLTTGPKAGGGYLVRASLPLGGFGTADDSLAARTEEDE